MTTTYEGPIDHDLSAFTPDIARAISDTWICARDSTDREPIRAHYRSTRDKGLRGLIAGMMKGEG